MAEQLSMFDGAACERQSKITKHSKTGKGTPAPTPPAADMTRECAIAGDVAGVPGPPSPISAHGWAPLEGSRPLTPEEEALIRDYESRAELKPGQRHVLDGYRYLIAEGLVRRLEVRYERR